MNDKSSDDIYLSKNKVERYRKTLLRCKNGQTAVLFLDALALQNASNIRIRDYGYASMRLLSRKDDTPMKTWTKEELKKDIKIHNKKNSKFIIFDLISAKQTFYVNIIITKNTKQIFI